MTQSTASHSCESRRSQSLLKESQRFHYLTLCIAGPHQRCLTVRFITSFLPSFACAVRYTHRLVAEGDEGVEAFCDRVVGGCGVLLLPATVYGHAPAVQRSHFRIGLGRRDLPQCLEVLEGFLRQQGEGQGCGQEQG